MDRTGQYVGAGVGGVGLLLDELALGIRIAVGAGMGWALPARWDQRDG